MSALLDWMWVCVFPGTALAIIINSVDTTLNSSYFAGSLFSKINTVKWEVANYIFHAKQYENFNDVSFFIHSSVMPKCKFVYYSVKSSSSYHFEFVQFKANLCVY